MAFRNNGHDFFSNDIQGCSGGFPEYHIQNDCFKVLHSNEFNTTLNFLGGHPDCTFLTNAGVRWLASKTEKPGFFWSFKYNIYINQERYKKMFKAALFFKSLLENVKRVGLGYIENPIMHKYAMEIINEKPTQIIQPYHYGLMETKATCLWLVGLPKLKETNNVYKEMMKLPYKERAKIHYCSPGPERAKIRSKTYPVIAEAMAKQWGEFIFKNNRKTEPLKIP